MQNPVSTSGLRFAARQAIEDKSTNATSIIGRGRPENTYFELSGAYQGSCAVRTAKYGWFAFPWNVDHWGTLRDCKYVLVATADSEEGPTAIEVYFFKAEVVRQAFDEARESKISAGLKVSNHTGMWIALHLEPESPKRSNVGRLADWVVRIPIGDHSNDIAGTKTAGPKSSIGLSIAEAKPLLAAHYGVDMTAIEIVIRG